MVISTKKLLHEIRINNGDQHLVEEVADCHVDLWKHCFLEVLCISVDLNAFVLSIFEGESHEWEGVFIDCITKAFEEGWISFYLSLRLEVVLIDDGSSKENEDPQQQLQQHSM